MIRPDDVTFWRNTGVAQILGASLSVAPVPETFTEGVPSAQRGNVELVIMHSTSTGVAVTTPSSPSVVALNDASAGRTVVVLNKVYNTADGDSVPTTTTIASLTAGGIQLRRVLAGGDGADPLGLDGVVHATGVSATAAAASLAITERSRVVRCWMIRSANAAPPSPTPDLSTGVADAFPPATASSTNGSDYGYLLEDLGNFDVGETVAAQSSALGASRSWTVLTICIKLLPTMVPQILGSDFFSAAAGTVAVAQGSGLSATYPVNNLKAGDHCFVTGAGTSASNGYSRIDSGGSTTGIFHKVLDSGVDPTTTITGSGSLTAAQIFIVRGLDPNNPYSIADDVETEDPVDVPSRTIVRAGDIDISIAQFRGSTTTATAYTPSGGKVWMNHTSNNSNNRQKCSWAFRYGSLTPGSLAGLTATCGDATLAQRGSHLVLHQLPPVSIVEGEFEFGLIFEALPEVAAGAVFVEGEFEFSMTMTGQIRTSRPRRLRPRREYVWIYGLDGDVKAAIS